MSTVKVSPEEFEKAVMKAMSQYGDKVLEMMEKETKAISRETVKTLKARSPVGKTGSYAKGWSHKAKKTGTYKLTETVYNRTDYQLTHLLEKSHKAGKTGWYPTHVDHTGMVANIEEESKSRFIEEVMRKL